MRSVRISFRLQPNPRMTESEIWTDAADPVRRIGRAVEFHAEIGSTNDRAARALHEPDGEGLAVVAELQTAGRGRRGRRWESPPGVNLMVSVGLRPLLAAHDAAWLGAAVALAVRDACGVVGALAVKWPNDIVTGEGDKVAGLLLETAIEGDRLAEAVIGIGVNVNWRRASMPLEIAARATSLADLAGHDVDRVALLGRLLAALDREVTAIEEGISPIPRLRMASWLDGRVVSISLSDGSVTGSVAGMTDDGSLLLEGPHGVVAIGYGEVVRVEPRSGVTA